MSELRLATRIDRVTLYEDRAEVTRVGELAPGKAGGALVVVLPGLTPLVDPARLRVTGAGLTVDDVQTRPRWVQDDSEAGRQHLRATLDLRQLERARDRCRTAVRRAQARRDEAERMLHAYAEELSASLWAGELDERALTEGDEEAPLDEGFGRLERHLRGCDRELDAARQEAEEAERELGDLARAIRRRPEREHRLACDITLSVSVEGGGAREVEVSYVVPCALWRPAHEAALSTAGEGRAEVRWQTFATVWQRTGEDWDDVELCLSTARPSASARLPTLGPDELRLRSKTAEERAHIFVQHREASVPTREIGGAAPGVDDGGAPQELRPPRRVSVPSGGKPQRVAADAFASPAELDLVAVPELDPRVYLRAALENRSGRPLLAGPVTLRRQGAWVGVADIPLVGAGAGFELSFGSDDRFEVRSSRKRLDEDRRLGRDRRVFLHEVEVRTLGSKAEPLTLQLRVPVSELKQVKVLPSEAHCTHGAPQPDEHGRVPIRVEARPGHIERVTLGFSFESSGEVVLPDPW